MKNDGLHEATPPELLKESVDETIVSDLHLEFPSFVLHPSLDKAEVIILTVDIGI